MQTVHLLSRGSKSADKRTGMAVGCQEKQITRARTVLWGGGAQTEIPVQKQRAQEPPEFVPGEGGQKPSTTKGRERGNVTRALPPRHVPCSVLFWFWQHVTELMCFRAAEEPGGTLGFCRRKHQQFPSSSGYNQGLSPFTAGLKVTECPPQRWNPSQPRGISSKGRTQHSPPFSLWENKGEREKKKPQQSTCLVQL